MAFGNPAAATPAAATSLSFGQSAKTSGFNFGAPAPASSSVGFAVSPITSAPSFGGFGTNAVQPQASVAPLLVSSAITPVAQSTGFSFGVAPAATTSQPSSGLSFGVSSSAASAAPKMTFNPPMTTQSGLSFGAPVTTQTGLSFGTPVSAVAPLTGFGVSTQAQQTAPTLTLPAVSTSSGLTGISFGQQAATTAVMASSVAPNTGLSFGLGSQPAQAIPNGLAQPQPVVSNTTSAQTTGGLGGIDMNNTQPKTIEGKNEATKVKETQVPKEIIQTVEDMKAYIKQQKTLSSDIARTSTRKLANVTDEIQRLNWTIQEISNDVDHNKSAVKLLRNDTSRIIQHADMAQRTQETPSGLQFENVLPQIYFNELIHKYENDLLTLKHQVELTEKHLQSLSHPQSFTAQDLKRGLQQLHESFIALAGRLQETHTKVDAQKEQYLNLRKFMLRDSTNVFEEQPKASTDVSVGNPSKVQYGPSPFSNSFLGNFSLVGNPIMNPATAVPPQTTQWQPSQQQSQSFFGTGNTTFGFKR